MCLAIAKPAGIDVPEAHLNSGWLGNSDGAGYAFVKDGKVEIRKGFGKWKEFISAYSKDAEGNKESPFSIHFRMRSVGDIGMDNTHPFRYEHGCMIHNGTISGTEAKSYKGPTDTEKFIEKFGKHFSYEFLKEHKDELAGAMGFNKLVFLFSNKELVIVNERAGTWHEGVWYSNGSFKRRVG